MELCMAQNCWENKTEQMNSAKHGMNAKHANNGAKKMMKRENCGTCGNYVIDETYALTEKAPINYSDFALRPIAVLRL
ncbi:hypothetical protein A4R26_29235 [Niastella populi]|uniref:Uncharacterized protein n=1 Tax=Niastella populi TaxID=550983 RepID=A0A1V9F0X4_9BACT|nr:hypothetical protein A4R26_29235 [Niastella populi]